MKIEENKKQKKRRNNSENNKNKTQRKRQQQTQKMIVWGVVGSPPWLYTSTSWHHGTINKSMVPWCRKLFFVESTGNEAPWHHEDIHGAMVPAVALHDPTPVHLRL